MNKYFKYMLLANLLLMPCASFAQTYTYDNLGRVKTVTNNGVTITYNNDAADNRTSVTNSTLSPPPPPPTSNSSPVCQSYVANIPAPYYANVTVSLAPYQIFNLCTDPDGDALTIVSVSPALSPATQVLPPGNSSVVYYFVVSDNKGGTASATYKYQRN